MYNVYRTSHADNSTQVWNCSLMQRARKENAKIREQMERQRLAKEREVCDLCVLPGVSE